MCECAFVCECARAAVGGCGAGQGEAGAVRHGGTVEWGAYLCVHAALGGVVVVVVSFKCPTFAGAVAHRTVVG